MRCDGNRRRPPPGSSSGGFGFATFCLVVATAASTPVASPEPPRVIAKVTAAITSTSTPRATSLRCLTTRLRAASLRARRCSVVRGSRVAVCHSCGNRIGGGRGSSVLLRRWRPARSLRPLLVEVDAPLVLFVALELELGAERPSRAAAEARDLLLGATYRRLVAALDRLAQRLDQLLDDRGSEGLAGLVLPDHEAAARIIARPTRVALAVLDDVLAAHRTRAEVGALDLDVLQVAVEPLDDVVDELGCVLDEALARVLAALDLVEPRLPVARHLGRGDDVLAEQLDHLHALLRGVERASLALDVADGDQALDDRRARGRRADAGLLHRLAHLVVGDLLAGRLHRAEQRRLGVAPRRLGLLRERLDLQRLHALALVERRQQLLPARVVLGAVA